MNRLTIEERKKANKIRCKLLYTIDRDIRETKKKNQGQFLINSMTLNEIEEKFLLFPNYKMKLSTTFTKIANKYIVMQTVDKRLKQNFFFTDYYQDIKKSNLHIIKPERKKISANNIIKLSYLESHELQSPIPEIFTNKMDIGDKKLIKQKYIKEIQIFSLNGNENSNVEMNHKIKDIVIKEKNKKEKNTNDDDSINSLTMELIQKKSNIISVSLNHKNKAELKRRKNQIEAIKKLRQFCYQKLRIKRRYITKSSHRNLLYISTKFEEEEKNTSYSSKKNKNFNKNNNTKFNRNKNSKHNSRRKYDSTNESKKKKIILKKNKERKKTISSAKKTYKNHSSKKVPPNLKKTTKEKRKSLLITNNIISGKLDHDILRFKKNKKEKNENNIKIINEETDDLFKIRQGKLIKRKTGIAINRFKEKFSGNKIFFMFNKQKTKIKNIGMNVNEINCPTKRNSSENNFFNRKYDTRRFNKIYSSKSLIKPVNRFLIKRKFSTFKIEKDGNCSTPEKNENKKPNLDNIFIKSKLKKKKTEFNNSWCKYEKNSFKPKGRKSLIFNGNLKIPNKMSKVEEEDY